MCEKETIRGSIAEKCSRMANEYDSKKEGWLGPEVVFGMMYEFVKQGQLLLDIGIGTGLSSILFHKAGLHIYGMDLSKEMLDACKNKGFAEDLKVHDLTVTPYPYADEMFDHVVCIGVLNHFEDLKPVFNEATRLLKNDGLFAIVIGDRKENEEPQFQVQHEGATYTMYRYSAEVINKLLEENNFKNIRELEFFVYGQQEKDQPIRLRAYIARRQKKNEK